MLQTPVRADAPVGQARRPGGVDTLTLAALVLVLLALALGVVAVLEGGTYSAASWWLLGLTAPVVAVVTLLALVWRRRAEPGRPFVAWALLSVAALAICTGVAVAGLLPGAAQAQRYETLEWAYFIGGPFYAVALLMLPTPAQRDRWEAVLDVLDGVAAALGMAVATLWLLPDDPGHGFSVDEVAHSAALVGTIGVLVYVVARQRRPGGLPLRQMEIIIGATALVTVGSIAAYRGELGLELLALPTAASLLLLGCLAGAQAVVRPVIEVEGPSELRRRELWATLVPVVPIGAGLFSIAWYATQPVPLPYTVGTVMVVLVFVLVLVFLVVRVLGEHQARRLRTTASQAEVDAVTRDAWFRSMTADIADAVLLVDPSGRVVVSSPAAERALGTTAAALTRRDLSDYLSLERAQWHALLVTAAHRTEQAVTQPALVNPDSADPRPVDLLVTALTESAGLKGYVVTLRDVSERIRMNAALAEQQLTDPLTGLRNRSGFLVAGASFVDGAEPGTLAVVALDLERFGLVNDTRGHDAGDELLRRTAAVVAACAECGGQAVGRIGGDEFAVLVLVPEGGSVLDVHVRDAVGHLRGMLTGLSDVRGDGLPVTAHAGYAVLPDGGIGADELLRRAEVAVETARRRGSPDPVRFDADEHAARLADVSLEADLRAAIADGGLVLHYQPVIDLRADRVVGVEALARWPHPTLGMVGPDRFVALAERSGFALDLGRWVMRQALSDVRAMRAASGAGRFRVAVNVSAQEVTAALPEEIEAALTETGAAADDLVVEVTESALFSRTDEARPALERIRRRGVVVALDDFGTGYSSLALLTRLPVDLLKVDRSFVSRVEEQGEEWALVRGVLQLCQSLRLRSVAEGVETEPQADLLRAMGCDEAQGYLFARPMPLDEACAWMAARSGSSSTLRG